MAFNAKHSCFLCGTQRKWWKASSGPGRGSSSGSPRGTKRRSSSEADGGSNRGSAGAGRGMLTMRFPGTWPDGFVTFDICRAKIGHDECGIYMPPIFWQQIGGQLEVQVPDPVGCDETEVSAGIRSDGRYPRHGPNKLASALLWGDIRAMGKGPIAGDRDTG